MRIAIFGLHGGTQASYIPEEWDRVWRMAHDPEAASADRIFEAHSEPIARKYGGEAYIERLREFASDGLLTTLWPYNKMEHCKAPMRWCINRPPQSSVAFMFMHALGSERVGLFGINMADGEEYGYQRPNMAWLIGFAEGRDMDIHIDPASSLLKSQWTAGIYGHPENIDDFDYRLGHPGFSSGFSDAFQ